MNSPGTLTLQRANDCPISKEIHINLTNLQDRREATAAASDTEPGPISADLCSSCRHCHKTPPGQAATRFVLVSALIQGKPPRLAGRQAKALTSGCVKQAVDSTCCCHKLTDGSLNDRLFNYFQRGMQNKKIKGKSSQCI